MTLTLEMAGTVRSTVLAKYATYLPDELVSGVRTKPISEIFLIQAEGDYKKHFDAYYRSWFATINVVALGGTRRLIDIAKSEDDVYDSFACPAFCSPAMNPLHRKIYINRDAGSTVGTLYHEFIHYLSHGNFYPEMYAMGGKSPVILEGVTEYLTREVNPAVKKDRSDQQKYQRWFSEISTKISGSDALDRMAAMAFKGELGDVATLGGTIPKL